MPQCMLCVREGAKKTEYGVINSNHLMSKHEVTLAEYVKEFGDPNRDLTTIGASRRGTSTKTVTDKLKKPKATKPKAQLRTIDELYDLEKTIKVPDNFICVTKENEHLLERMISECYSYKRLSIDTETTGLDMFNDKITDMIVTIYEPTYTRNYFIPFGHVDRDDVIVPGQLDVTEVMSKLKPILESEDIRKSLYGAYFDATMLWTSFGILLKGVIDPRCKPTLVGDTMKFSPWEGEHPWEGGWDGLIGSNILNENDTSHKMKDFYKKYLHDSEPIEDIKSLGVETFEEQFGKIQFFRVPMKVATCYGCKDGYMTRRIEEFQKPYIDTVGRLKNIFYGIEMPLLPVLVDMRIRGILVDLAFARELELELTAKRDNIRASILEVVGDINLNSTKQLANALFEELGYPRIEKDSTKASVLEELAERGYEVAALISDYKKMEKIIGTYLSSLPEKVSRETGRVHCRFNQSGPKTGRFSSSDPNLQNLPAKFKEVRRIFKASNGYALISADYSQVEPRLLAHVSADPTMIKAYKDDKDLYAMMAARVFSLVAYRAIEKLNHEQEVRAKAYKEPEPIEVQLNRMTGVVKQLYQDNKIQCTETMDHWTAIDLELEDCCDGTLYRKFMKTLLLGMMYSMSEKGLAERLKIGESDAKDIMDFFFKAFPDVKKTMTKLQLFCKQEGFIETPWGRKRRLPDIWSDTFWIRKKAERQVLNSEIQGGAADLMKIALLLVGYDPRIEALGGRLLLTVHDEIIAEAPKEHAIQVAKYLVEDMIAVADLSVPLKVDAEIYTDGRWYGNSVDLKLREGAWIISSKGEPITEEQINWSLADVDNSPILDSYWGSSEQD